MSTSYSFAFQHSFAPPIGYCPMTAPRERSEQWQVYAIAERSAPSRFRVGDRSLTAFRIDEVSVIVGAPRDLPIEGALRDQHRVVLQLADRFDPILPVRFGQRMTSARIAEVVRPSAHVLAESLAHVRGRRQMTLRVLGPPAHEGRRPTSGTEYLVGRRAAHALPDDALALEEALARFVVDRRTQPGRDGVRLTLFHLVDRADVTSYQAVASEVERRIRPWRIALSGPWPPFAFAPELPA
jgi:hypothetical protein